MSIEASLAELESQVGQEVHVSEWITVDQAQVNAFAGATNDHQWIHVDPERARAESPFKTPVAHGFLTLSLVPCLRGIVESDRPLFPGVKNVINYGLNKVRFPAPVPVGARIRGHFTVSSVSQKRDAIELVEVYSAEVEGQERPACVAETIMRLYF
jgi:acyl dehydratase